MSLTTQDKQEIKSMLDTSIREGIAHLPTVEMVREIVKEETAHLPTVEVVRDIVKIEIDESMKTGPLKAAFSRIEEKIDFGIYRVEVLYEDTRSDIKAMSEMLIESLKIKDKVKDHEYRLTDIENMQPMMIKTLKTHSKKLNTLYER